VLEPVRQSGDRIGEATVLRDLGQVALYRDDLDQGAELMNRSLELFLAEEDWKGAGFATIGMIGAEDWMDSIGSETLDRCRRAREWFARADYAPGVAAAHNATALTYVRAKRWDDAEPWVKSALAVAEEVGDSHRYAKILRRYSELHAGRGDLAAAQHCLNQALETFLALGDHRCAGYASTRLGQLMLAGGDSSGARRQFREALDAGRRLADPAAQAAAWDAMAEALLQSESRAQAETCLQRSIRAWQVADRPQKAAEAVARLARVQGQPAG
jgi:tetratricopeptide (TPR) repeat protein